MEKGGGIGRKKSSWQGRDWKRNYRERPWHKTSEVGPKTVHSKSGMSAENTRHRGSLQAP